MHVPSLPHTQFSGCAQAASATCSTVSCWPCCLLLYNPSCLSRVEDDSTTTSHSNIRDVERKILGPTRKVLYHLRRRSRCPNNLTSSGRTQKTESEEQSLRDVAASKQVSQQNRQTVSRRLSFERTSRTGEARQTQGTPCDIGRGAGTATSSRSGGGTGIWFHLQSHRRGRSYLLVQSRR